MDGLQMRSPLPPSNYLCCVIHASTSYVSAAGAGAAGQLCQIKPRTDEKLTSRDTFLLGLSHSVFNSPGPCFCKETIFI